MFPDLFRKCRSEVMSDIRPSSLAAKIIVTLVTHSKEGRDSFPSSSLIYKRQFFLLIKICNCYENIPLFIFVFQYLVFFYNKVRNYIRIKLHKLQNEKLATDDYFNVLMCTLLLIRKVARKTQINVIKLIIKRRPIGQLLFQSRI